MANPTLADMQRQWYAEDTGAGSTETVTDSLTGLFPHLGSLFNTTKINTSNGYAISGASPDGGFPFGYQQTANPNNNNELILIAGALAVVVFAAVIFKAAR